MATSQDHKARDEGDHDGEGHADSGEKPGVDHQIRLLSPLAHPHRDRLAQVGLDCRENRSHERETEQHTGSGKHQALE